MNRNQSKLFLQPVFRFTLQAATLMGVIGMAASAANASDSGNICVYGNVPDFENLIGKTTTMSLHYVTYNSDAKGGWTYFDDSAKQLREFPADHRLIVGIPLFPKSTNETLPEAAAGSYQSHYDNIARALVAGGHQDAVIRIAWEFQGNWFLWGYGAPGQDKAHYCDNYKAAFRNVVKAFRAASADFKFDWNPALTDPGRMPDPAACYPGDDVVDYVGMDVYDYNYIHIADPAQRFDKAIMNTKFGLKWQAQFAQQHHKPISFPEWGAGEVEDNPYFMQQMFDWFNHNDVAYQCYWNGDHSTGYDGNLAHHPKQMELMKAFFSAGGQR